MTRKALLGRVSDVDVRLLRIFQSIVKSGGIAAAELELNIGRSTISRHLTDLEVRLGLRLCTRGPSGFSLTPEGERVLDAASTLLSAIDSFQLNVNDIHQELRGKLTIALFDKTISNPLTHISKAFTLFDDIAPDVTLELFTEPTNAIESGVLDGRFDLGIIPTHRKSSSLVYYPLYTEQMYLYCGTDHPLYARDDAGISLRDVRRCKYAGLGFHSPNMMVSTQLKLQRAADVYDQEALAMLVLSGRYIGFLPDHYVGAFVKKDGMRPICPKRFNYQSLFAAIVRRSPEPSRLLRLFVDCLQSPHELRGDVDVTHVSAEDAWSENRPKAKAR